MSSVPGPEAADATGDPVVITRYLYKPDASEGLTHFNDNRRLHLFVVDVATGRIEQLTTGTHYEHSVDWSPSGDEILFLTNRDADDDEFFNYDVFAIGSVSKERVMVANSARGSSRRRVAWYEKHFPKSPS